MSNIVPERPEIPKHIADTEAHVIMPNMGLIPSQLGFKPDIETGGSRTQRFGAWLGMNIIPHLDKQIPTPDSPLLLPEPPPVLLVADTLQELKDRLIFEIEVMIKTADDVLSGKITIDENGVPVLNEDAGEESPEPLKIVR